MSANLTDPFGPSCCDGGAEGGYESCRPCGCDPGANYQCARHKAEWRENQILYGIGPSHDQLEIESIHNQEVKPVAEHKINDELFNILMEREVRRFETGATRDVDTSKLDFEGFESPLVMERFAEFMHTNRLQKDGQLRDSDNWQKGIPKSAYMKSMWRHLMDVWLHHRGWGSKAKEPLEVALCALRFNINGYLFEVLKEKF